MNIDTSVYPFNYDHISEETQEKICEWFDERYAEIREDRKNAARRNPSAKLYEERAYNRTRNLNMIIDFCNAIGIYPEFNWPGHGRGRTILATFNDAELYRDYIGQCVE